MLIHRLPASRLGSRPISGVHAFTDLPALASARLSVLPRVAHTNLAEPHTGCVTGFEFHLTSKHSRRSRSWQCRRMKSAAKFPYTRNRAQPERFLSPLSRKVREGGPATRREMVSRTLFFPFKFYYTRSYPSSLNNSHPNLEEGVRQVREAQDFQSCSVSAVRNFTLQHVVAGVRGATRSCRLLDLGLRIFVTTAWMILVVTLACIHTAGAQPYHAHTDVEFALGGGVLNGTGTGNPEGVTRTIKMTAQIFADRLFPVTTIGEGVFEIGPYAKGALLDGVSVPLIAGGAILGYRVGKYEILVHIGLAYATERIGENTSNGVTHLGQTKATYDLGLSLRYDINQFFISAGYQHNSDGAALGIHFIDGKGQNPGYDNVLLGIGLHF